MRARPGLELLLRADPAAFPGALHTPHRPGPGVAPPAARAGRAPGAFLAGRPLLLPGLGAGASLPRPHRWTTGAGGRRRPRRRAPA